MPSPSNQSTTSPLGNLRRMRRRGDDSTGSGADAVKTSTKAVPNELPEFDLDAEPNPFVIGHMKKIGESFAITLVTVAFPDLRFNVEKD